MKAPRQTRAVQHAVDDGARRHGGAAFEDRRAVASVQRRLAEASQDSLPVRQLHALSALAAGGSCTVPMQARAQLAPGAGSIQRKPLAASRDAIPVGVSLKAPGFNGRVAQLVDAEADTADIAGQKSKVKHTSGTMKFNDGMGDKYAEVGEKMEATLYPGSPMKGQAVGPQWTWMDGLKKRASTTVIRAHLLNHDLGGKAMPYNLFPLSNAANKEHSVVVEQRVKSLLFAQPQALENDGKPSPVNYTVEVVDRDDDNMKAAFQCDWTGKDVYGTAKISSNLGKDKGFRSSVETDYDGNRDVVPFNIPKEWAKKAGQAGISMPGRQINGIDTETVVEGSTFKRSARWKGQLATLNEAESNEIIRLLNEYKHKVDPEKQDEFEAAVEETIDPHIKQNSSRSFDKSARLAWERQMRQYHPYRRSIYKEDSSDDESEDFKPRPLAPTINGLTESDWVREKAGKLLKSDRDRRSTACLNAIKNAISKGFQ